MYDIFENDTHSFEEGMLTSYVCLLHGYLCFSTDGEIRTHTYTGLSRFPLPVGVHPHLMIVVVVLRTFHHSYRPSTKIIVVQEVGFEPTLERV